MADNILIVDDQVELTEILGEYFRVKKGYNVLTATDGKAALGLIKEHGPKLVLLDMKLPSVNGLEILKLLRKEHPACKVIVMTAYDMEYKKEIDAVGYDGFFIKPILFEELKNAVDALLSGKITEQVKSVTGSGGEGLVAKARIAIIEIRANIATVLKEYLEHSPGNDQYFVLNLKSGALSFDEVIKFSPDIILYDIVEIGEFSKFASELMKLVNPPKEIILFGDPKLKWEEVDLLVKKGMTYIATPLTSSYRMLLQYPEFELPAKETVERLAEKIREACFKHGLVVKKGEDKHAREEN